MYIALNLLGVALSFFVILRHLKRKGLSSLATNPLFAFTLYFLLIHFITPTLKANNGKFRYQSEYSDLGMIYSAILALVFYLLAILFCSYFQQRYKIGYLTLQSSMKDADWAKFGGACLLLIGSFFAFRDLQTISSTAGSLETYLSDRLLFNQARSSSRVFTNFMISGSALLLGGMLTSSGSKSYFIIWICGTLYAIQYFSAISSRNGILIIILLNAIIYLFYRPSLQKITRASLVRLLLICSLIVTLFGSMLYVTFQRYNRTDTSYLLERRDNIIFYMLDGAFGNDEARIWMIDNEHDYFWGSTYLASFVAPIPRILWEEKPYGAGPKLINMIRPGSYIPGESGNNSLTSGLIVEARMNYGLLGVVGILFLWSWVANLLIFRAYKSSKVHSQIGLIFFAFSLSSMFLYSEFLGYLVRAGTIVFPIILLGALQPKRGIKH